MSGKTVSVLKERRPGERRVILLPDGVARFTEAGYRVLVESDAGLLAGYVNDEYLAIGAEIVDTRTAWSQSNVVFKYKAPGPEEYRHFRPDMHLASFMHAEGNLELVEVMRSSGMSAYALEFFRTESGEFPVPVSDNEISGKMAIILASYHLQSHLGGNGVLMAHIPGARRARLWSSATATLVAARHGWQLPWERRSKCSEHAGTGCDGSCPRSPPIWSAWSIRRKRWRMPCSRPTSWLALS